MTRVASFQGGSSYPFKATICGVVRGVGCGDLAGSGSGKSSTSCSEASSPGGASVTASAGVVSDTGPPSFWV